MPISLSEQVETLLMLGRFVAEQFAILVSCALGVGIPHSCTVAAACLPCLKDVSSHEPLLEIRMRAQRT